MPADAAALDAMPDMVAVPAVRQRASMRRVILGYLPANVIPALTSIGSIYVFTRLLSPAQFGTFNLAFSIVMVAQTVVFFGPALGTMRFYAAAEADGTLAAFVKTTYALLIALALVAAGMGTLAFGLAGRELDPALGNAAAFILPLLLLRALVACNQTLNRAANRMGRLNLIECLHAALGFAAGMLLVLSGARTGGALMAGLLGAAAFCAALDVRLIRGLRAAVPLDRMLLRQYFRFCWPLALAFIGTCALQYADRFMVDAYDGAVALSIYVVAFSLVDRPLNLVCLSITAATFPMAVEAYVREGPEAGRKQAGHNGAVLLALALPACAGIVLTRHAIAAVMVGPDYRDGVAWLLPVMAATSFLRQVGAHYIDHAFHLSNRSFRLFMVYAPSALGNVVLSALLVPRYGMIAAAYAALGCQAVAVIAGFFVARGVLPLWLPGAEVAKIVASTAAMVAMLAAVPLMASWSGLAEGVALGLGTYAALALALDLGGARRLLARRLIPSRALA